MPLPISSQIFMPNPLVGIQSAEAGFKIGKESSDFANFTSGLLSGAERGLGLIEQAASIKDKFGQAAQERRRQEEERKRREEQRDERAREQADRRLDIEDRRLDIQSKENAAKDRRALISTSLKDQEANRKARLENVAGSFLADGNNVALIAELGESSKTRFNSLARLVKEDADLGQAISKKIEEQLASGRFANVAEAEALQEINNSLSRSAKISTSAEAAAEAQQSFRALGLMVEPGDSFEIRRSDASGALPSETKLFRVTESGREIDLGSVVALEDTLTSQGAKSGTLIKAVNQINERQRIIQDTRAQLIKQTTEAEAANREGARLKAQQTTGLAGDRADQQIDRPAKQVSTSTTAATTAGTPATDSLRQKLKRNRVR